MFKNKKRAASTNPKSRLFITTGLSHAPALLQNSTSISFACFLNTFLVEIGIDIDPSNAASCCSLKDVLASMFESESSNLLAIIRNRMKGHKVFLLCDGANKGMHHAVKVISWWFVDYAMNFLLDSDAAAGINLSAAGAIDISLKKNR